MRRVAREAHEVAERGEDSSILPANAEKDILMTEAHSCLRPMQLLIFEPMCLALCAFSSVILGILYLFFESFVLVYRFSLQQCVFLSLGS